LAEEHRIMQKPKKQEGFDDSFYKLAGEIATALAKNRSSEKTGRGITRRRKEIQRSHSEVSSVN